MTNTLSDVLGFSGGDVFSGGRVIFSIPVKHATMDTVTVLGSWEPSCKNAFPNILVGSGTCCHGHLYQLVRHGETRPYVLDQIVSIDTNVMDILPVSVEYEKVGFPNGGGVLVVGQGCAGAGVRLVGMYYPRLVEVISGKEYAELVPSGQFVSPAFRLDPSAHTIHLDLHLLTLRVKEGKMRDKTLPSIVFDGRTEEFRRSPEPYRTVDLTSRLGDIGVDLRETMKRLSGFRRFRRS